MSLITWRETPNKIINITWLQRQLRSLKKSRLFRKGTLRCAEMQAETLFILDFKKVVS